MGVRRLAVGPSTLGLPSVGFIPCRCGRDSVSGPESPARRIVPLDVERCPGRRRGGLEAVDAGGRPWRRPVSTARNRIGWSCRSFSGRAGRRRSSSASWCAPPPSCGRRRRRPARRRLRPGVPAGARRGGSLRARLAGAGHRDGAVAELSLDETVRCRRLPTQRQCRAHAPSRRHRHAQRGGPVTAVRSRWTPGQARRTDRLLGRLVALHPSFHWPGRPRTAATSSRGLDTWPGPALSPSLAPAIRTRSTRRWSSPIRCRTSRAP